MKKLVGIFINTFVILGLLLIVQTNKTLAAGTFNTAVELKENIAVEERIEVGEEDYYYFITQESALYEIETVSEIDTWGDLYNENLTKIASNDDDGEGTNFKISMELEPNKKYYIKVKALSSYVQGNYKIVLKKLILSSISGKVSLPNGQVAPVGGIDVDVQAMRKIVRNSYSYEQSKSIYIKEGENSAEYNFEVPYSENEVEYKISYLIINNKTNYIRVGYYSENGTMLDFNLAGIVKVLDKDVNSINLELIKGILVSGKISLPDGEVSPSNGSNIDVFARDKQASIIFNTNVYLNEGSNEGTYSIVVPAGNESRSYVIGYFYYDFIRGSHVSNAYYNSIKTTTNLEKATLVEVSNNDVQNINMTLIPAKIIRGTINLPDDIDIPDNIDVPYYGPIVKIVANSETDDNKVQKDISLKNGIKSVEYNLLVPSDSELRYKVSYELPEYYIGNALKRGYYSNNGTVANRKDASAISISGEEIPSIDMTVLKLQDIPDDYSDILQNAALIENNSVNDGIINHLGDKDYFKFQILQTSLVKLYTTGSLVTRGQLFNSKGENIVTRNQRVMNNNFSVMQILEPGTYYLGISSDKLGVYSLNVETTINSSENQYKISVADRGQIPTIEAIYFEGQRGEFEFDFSIDLLNDVSKVGNEYVVTLMGFDWSRADKYYVWINDGTYLLKKILTSADKGKTIILMPDDTYTNTNINIENAGDNFNVQSLSLYHNWLNGQSMFIGNINNHMYIPMGEYGIQINGSNETSGYSLLKDKINISKENNLIYFKADELAKLDINMEDYSGSELKFSSLCAAYFNMTYSLSSSSNINNIYVSKANYNRVWISFKTKDNWEYQYPISDANITLDKILNFDSELLCEINLANSHFNPNEARSMENQLQIIDSLNNNIDYIRNINFKELKTLKGKIKLENATEKYELTIDSLSNPYIVLPNTNGTFNMTFYVDEGPIKIKSASTVITIGDPNGSSLKNYDLNLDGFIDEKDMEILKQAFGIKKDDLSYSLNKDLNSDGIIDIYDLVILSKKIQINKL